MGCSSCQLSFDNLPPCPRACRSIWTKACEPSIRSIRPRARPTTPWNSTSTSWNASPAASGWTSASRPSLRKGRGVQSDTPKETGGRHEPSSRFSYRIFSLKHFAFQTIRPVVSRKNAFFRLVSAGRRGAAASHFAFFKGEMPYQAKTFPKIPDCPAYAGRG